MSDILTDTEAAALLDCAPSTVQELARTHQLPAVQFGRSWRFPRAALVEYLNRRALEHMVTPAPRLLEKPKAAQIRKIEVKLPPVLPRLSG